MPKNNYEFTPQICECCGQALSYLLPIDWGTAVIVKAVAAAVRRKGINIIHPTKEMEVPANEWNYQRAITEGVLTSIQIGNFTRARVHGLIAKYEAEPGNWVLTTKGAQFLRHARIPRLAEVAKTTKGEDGASSHKMRYHKPEVFTCTVDEILNPAGETPRWEGISFEIKEGRIITDLPGKGE